MDSSKENVRKALIDLVARKDANIFQNLDVFENALRKIGDWPANYEIMALRFGLQQRLPWELQKAAAGIISAKTVNTLATNLARQHNIDELTALWAVESWAISLNLKFEATVQTPPVAVSAAQQAAPQAVQQPGNNSVAPTHSKPPTKNPAANDFSTASTRFGVVFGVSDNGQVKVFKSWSDPVSPQESAGMTYTPVKIEERAVRPLFAAAPLPRAARPAAAKKVVSLPSQSPATANQTTPKQMPVSPQKANPPQHQAQPQQPIRPQQPPAPQQPLRPQQQVAKPAPKPATPPAAPRVFNGSAEELFMAGQALTPGFSSRVNMAEALELFNQSAKMGYVPAKRKIGEIYLKGLGVKTDCIIAASWFKQAADAGDAQAQFQLGSLYQCGMGVEFNLAAAQEWLRRAAQQGHNEARELLNQMLQA